MTSTLIGMTDTITTVSGSVWTVESVMGQTFVTRKPADPTGWAMTTEHDGQRVPCDDATIVTHGAHRVLVITGGPYHRVISGFITAHEEG